MDVYSNVILLKRQHLNPQTQREKRNKERNEEKRIKGWSEGEKCNKRKLRYGRESGCDRMEDFKLICAGKSEIN